MNAERQTLLDVLAELSRVAPHLRMGQTLIAMSHLIRGASPEAIYNIEDEELIIAAERMIETYRARNLQVA